MATKCDIFASTALYLTQLPCPPLPLVSADGRVCSSHDLLASLHLNSPHGQPDREAALKLAFLRHDTALDFFTECCRFTVELVTLHRGGKAVGTCFRSPGEVCRGDPVHAAMARYCVAQDLLLGIESTEDYALSTYEELLQLHREHIIASQRLSCSLSSCDVTQLALLDSA